MGYRSEVRIATTKEGYERMCMHVDEQNKIGGKPQLLGTHSAPDFYDERRGSVAFGWDWVKWYEGQDGAVDDVMDALSEIEDAGVPFEFCRVGEDWDDIEYRCANENGDLALHVEPSVAINIFY